MFFYRAIILLPIIFLSACLGSGDKIPGPELDGAGEQVADAAASVGDHAEAARLFEKSIEADPDSVNILLGLGRSYIALGQLKRAENALLRAKSIERRNSRVHNELGRLALHRGKPSTALENFTEAVQFDRRNLDGLTGMAVALDYMSRHQEAQEIYQRALEIYPTNFVLLNNYALSQVLSGDQAKGRELLEELRNDPNTGDTVLSNLAIAYALEGDTSKAREILRDRLNRRDTDRTLNIYAEARRAKSEGKPIGHIIFD